MDSNSLISGRTGLLGAWENGAVLTQPCWEVGSRRSRSGPRSVMDYLCGLASELP